MMTEQKQAIPEGYKQTEIGLIPDDWEVKYFGELFESKISRKILKINEMVTFVGMQDVTENAQLANQTQIQYGKVRSGFTYFEKRDVLVAKITPCFENGKGCHTQHLETDIGFGSTEFHILRAKPSADSKYIFFWTTKDSFRAALESEMVGSAGHRRVPFSAIQNYLIPCPTEQKEQTAIANALSDVDALISELEKLIAKKQAIKTATMQQLLTGKTRLPEFALREDGTPKGYKQSELGEIPEDWGVESIDDNCRTFSGGTPSTANKGFYGGDIKWITSSDLNKGMIWDVQGRITNSGLESSAAKMIDANTFLIALYGATAGVCAISRIGAAINQAVLAVIPTSHNPTYLFYWFTKNKEEIIKTYTQGGQPNLSGDIIRAIKLPFPPNKEQTKIATILSDMDGEVLLLEQRLNKTRQIKQGMMQELLTGKTRLVKPEVTV